MLSFNSIWNEAEKKTEGNVNNFIERHFTDRKKKLLKNVWIEYLPETLHHYKYNNHIAANKLMLYMSK